MTRLAASERKVQDIEPLWAAAARHPKLGVYMDHNATTPVAPEALEAMMPFLTWSFGNASSVHEFGVQARYGVEKARARVAALVGAAEPESIVFTGCGSEADNIALFGATAIAPEKRHVITTAVEHKAILEPCRELEKRGHEVTFLPVNADCQVAAEQVEAAIRPDTLIVSIMFANNETGVIQPIAEIARVCRRRGVLFHTDAIQAVGRVPIDVAALGVDLLSISAHKLYGPTGVGALYVRPGLEGLKGVVLGGAHERGLRAGTENVAGIAAFGAAADLARRRLADDAARQTALRERFLTAMQSAIPDVALNGHPTERLPGSLNVRFAGLSGQRLLTELNQRGVAISAGSACSSVGTAHSHVLLGMGLAPDDAAASVRISLGRSNSEKDIDYVMGFLPELAGRLREEKRSERQ
jgi:cysteine desulfurase